MQDRKPPKRTEERSPVETSVRELRVSVNLKPTSEEDARQRGIELIDALLRMARRRREDEDARNHDAA